MHSFSKDAKIFIAGHRGLVGSAIVRQLQNSGYNNLITHTRRELELCDQQAVRSFFQKEKPDVVFFAAARVGGIHANNTYPADFIYDNLMVECNIINEAYQSGCQKLLFLGSSCIYPKLAPQPMSEESLLKGSLEPTNEPYGIAKIAGIKLCESYNRQYGVDYRSVMPTNLYGENDNFHPQDSHVIPAMMHRFHKAKAESLSEVVIWGSGTPKREFLHVDDMAAACLFVSQLDSQEYQEQVDPRCSHINVGTGEDCSIKELALTMAKVVGYKGNVSFDTTKPDGAPRKLLNVSLLKNLGWQASINLEQGLIQTYEWFCENYTNLRGVE